MKINLIPDEKSAEIKEQKSNFTATAVAIIIVATAVGITIMLLGVNKLKQKQIADSKKEVERIKKDLKNYSNIEKTLVTVEGGIEDIKKLNGSTYKWRRAFEEIEKTLPEGAQIKNYECNESKVSLRGSANSVDVLNKFLLALKEHKTTLEGGGGEGKTLFTNIKNPGYVKISDNQVDFETSFEIQGGVLWN
jgi:Tfp pilus assembly protein PilN